MGLRKAKALLVSALERGDFQHELRDVQKETNLLALGEVSVAFVVRLIKGTRGQDYASSPHHADPSVEVHIFRPRVEEEDWYVKAYLSLDRSAVFISVHRSYPS